MYVTNWVWFINCAFLSLRLRENSLALRLLCVDSLKSWLSMELSVIHIHGFTKISIRDTNIIIDLP